MAKILKFQSRKDEPSESAVKELLEQVNEQEFDNIIVFGVKDDDVFLAYTPFDSRTNLIGALESIKLWLWTKQAVVDELNELVEYEE